MADPTQYKFTLKEVATALVKEQGIHEGLWRVEFEFVLGAGMFGPTSAESKPGGFIQINNMQLSRQAADSKDSVSTVDAAVVNPASEQVSKT
jgi:hypothetical protein